MAVPQLYYAPEGATPIPIVRDFFSHPDIGDVHGPQADSGLNLLPVGTVDSAPDSRWNNISHVYTRRVQGDAVDVAFTATPRDIYQLLDKRRTELKAISDAKAVTLPAGFDLQSLMAAIIHRLDSGPGPYWVPRADGTWVSLSKAALTTQVEAVSTRIQAAALNAMAHNDVMTAFADAGSHAALMDHDLTVGWP